MATLVLDPPPVEFEALLERRRRLGLDHWDELLIVDPQQRKVDWLGLRDGEYEPIERSGLIDLGPAELTQRIDWP